MCTFFNAYKSILLFFLLAIIMSSCVKNEEVPIRPSSTFYHFLEKKINTEQLDSIYQEALILNPDTIQVDILLKTYRKSLKARPIRADILDTALALAYELDYKKGVAYAHDRKGLNYRYNSQFQESLAEHLLALKNYRKTSDTFGLLKCLNNTGVVLRKLNHEREAMKYYLEALEIAKELNDEKNIAISLNGIGNVFVNIEQYDKAMPYFREALVLETKNDNKRGMNYDLSNIGEVFMLNQEYDSALYYYSKALVIGLQRNYKADFSVDYYNLGMLYQRIGDYVTSNEYFLKAIPKLKEYDVKRYLSNAFIYMGINYTHLGMPKLAYQNIKDGIELSQKISTSDNTVRGYQALSDHYSNIKKYDLALESYRLSIHLRDSLYGEETKRNIASLESIYENKIKDKEIEHYQTQARLQNFQNISQWLIIIFLMISATVFIIISRLRRRNNRLKMEQMRNDIQEYIQRIDDYENKTNSESIENEQSIFYRNVEEYGLSEREIDVLLLISKGLKNDEIAEKLFLSVSTVKTHTRNIFTKLDVRNRIEAARKAQII